MQAIILAAGMGKRLGEYTKENTKCMVKVNGTPLIDRLLLQLSRLSLKRIILVVGYQSQKLIDHIGYEYKGLEIKYVHNEIYDKTNNIYSLALAKNLLMEDDTLLVESDLIFDDHLFTLITQDKYPNLALVAKYEPWMDGTVMRIDENNNIISFVPKDTFNYEETDKYYKTVNIYKLSKEFSKNRYVPFLEAYMTAVGNNEYYENVLRILSFINNQELRALPIKNEKWYEIDDKQDLDIAEVIFAEKENSLTKINSRYGGFWRFPQMLDFCYLVNPFFPCTRMIDEIQANFHTLLTSYPSGTRVNSLLASKCWNVEEEYIIPGNGASELINILLENIDGNIGIIRPTFEEYPNRLDNDRLDTYIPKNKDFQYGINELMQYYEKSNIKNLLIINPDNPSGNFIPKSDIISLAIWCNNKNINLIVDESFVDFTEEGNDNSLLNDDILEAYKNLIVIKSISKSYGVPGLRLGILAWANREMISKLKKQVSIWNINSFAEYFMQILTKYDNEYKQANISFVKERDRFRSLLDNVKCLHVIPSQANYFLCEVLGPFGSMNIANRLLNEYNILVSTCSAKKGLESGKYLRLAIRGQDDNDKLVKALCSVMS